VYSDAGPGRLFKNMASDGEYLCLARYHYDDLRKNILTSPQMPRGLDQSAQK
jgi:hypothetical protein